MPVRHNRAMRAIPVLISLLFSLGCATPEPNTDTDTDTDSNTETVNAAMTGPAGQEEAQPLVLSTSEEDLPTDLPLIHPWHGDLDGMVKRRVIRAVVAVSMTQYFLDGAVQRGITYEALQQFEEALNKKLGTGNLKVHVAIVPVARDKLLPALVEGRADIAAANLTITPERQTLVDFSAPAWSDVKEIVVTGPKSPELEELHDLAGQEIHVRRSSSYYESLLNLNEELRSAGKQEVRLVLADEHLEDEDLLQMVNAGLLPIVIVDSSKADFWVQIFDNLRPHPDLAVRTGGEIAWAFRKDSPQLAAEVNAFIRANRKGTLMGNILFKRYLKNTKWVTQALSSSEMAKFNATIDLFRSYGEQYDFDHLMLAALAYQESRLDQSVRSGAGAIGVMQLLQSTASDPNVGIPNIEELEPNIHAGTKYLRFLQDRYFKDAAMGEVNKTLFTFASYNAGPARVRGLRNKAEAAGLDPNVWFDNVEVIAAREIGRETVQYVSNIYKYYIAYRQAERQRQRKEQALPSD